MPDSGPAQPLTRTWAQLDPLMGKVLAQTTALVAGQDEAYDWRLSRGH